MKKVFVIAVLCIFLLPLALFAEGQKGETEAVDEGDELTLYTSLEIWNQ